MAVMVIDHAGEVLCTLGCVFEHILKIIRMGKAKNKGGGKKEEKCCQKEHMKATVS